MPTRRVAARQRERTGSVAPIRPGSTRWGVRVTESDGSRHRLRGGPWESEEEARQALIRWQAQRLDGDQARAALRLTPLKTVYLRSIEDLRGGLDESRDRRFFYRGAITGEAGIWRQVPDPGPRSPQRTRSEWVTPVPGRIILGDRPIGEITIEAVEEWARACRRTGMKPASVQKWGRHLSQCMAWAVARGYIPTNPVDGAVLVPRGSVADTRPKRYFLTLREMIRLAETTPIESRTLMETLLWSGCRQGEIRAISPGDLIHQPGAMLAIRHSISDNGGAPTLGPTKTRGSRRRVAIPRGLMIDLGEDAAHTGVQGEPLFRSPASRSWMRGDDLNTWWREQCNAAGLVGDPNDRHEGRRKPPTPHDARATGASLLLAAGAGVPEVQAWLGHTTPEMTLRLYTEVEEWGAEDPILRACRAEGLTVAEILDRVYEEAWRVYGQQS